MSSKAKGKILCFLAIILDVGAPLIATLMYFPLWVDRSAEATVSGMFVFLGLISAIPLFRIIKEQLRSPSAWLIWMLVFILFAALEAIVFEVKIIALVGFVANIIGAIIYKLGKKIGAREDTKDG